MAFLVVSMMALSCNPASHDGALEDDALADDGRTDISLWPETIGGNERPASVVAPSSYDGTTYLPVIFLLHGFTASAAMQDFYFQFSTIVEEYGFLLILPDGTRNPDGARFWNAMPACCDFYGSGVDDAAYLDGLLDEIIEYFPVDESRVYFSGHSNGGYMSYRMACDYAERIAGVMSFAGSTYSSRGQCGASEPVSVLQIHGDEDESVSYYDEQWGPPGAVSIVEQWANVGGCDIAVFDEGDSLDLVDSLSGSETKIRRYSEGCDENVHVELWTIEGGGHGPNFNANFRNEVVSWLLEQKK